MSSFFCFWHFFVQLPSLRQVYMVEILDKMHLALL